MNRIIYGVLFLFLLAFVSFYLIPNYIGDNSVLNILIVLTMVILGYVLAKHSTKKDSVKK